MLTVYKENVVSNLRIREHYETIDCVKTILNWRKTVNVSGENFDYILQRELRFYKRLSNVLLHGLQKLCEEGSSGVMASKW